MVPVRDDFLTLSILGFWVKTILWVGHIYDTPTSEQKREVSFLEQQIGRI